MSLRSHTIPRFYLERFAVQIPGKDGRIWVYARGTVPHRRSTRSQGFEKGYFEIFGSDGQRDESMEPMLARIEDESNDSLVCARSMLCDLSLVRTKLATYIAMLFRRSTVSQKSHARRWKQIAEPYAALTSNDEYLSDIASYFTRVLNRNFSVKDIRRMIASQANRFSDKTFTKNSFILDLLSFVEFGQREFLKKHWQVWHAQGPAEFVTSDNPVVSFVRYRSKDEVWIPGFGFGSKGVIIAFPLAPDACLVMLDAPVPTQHKHVDMETIQRMNEIVITCCDRFVYSRTRSEELSEAVDQHSGTSVPGVNAFMGRQVDENLIEEHMRRELGIEKKSNGHWEKSTAKTSG